MKRKDGLSSRPLTKKTKGGHSESVGMLDGEHVAGEGQAGSKPEPGCVRRPFVHLEKNNPEYDRRPVISVLVHG